VSAVRCPRCEEEGRFLVLEPRVTRRRQRVRCAVCGYEWRSKHRGVWDVAMSAIRQLGGPGWKIVEATSEGSAVTEAGRFIFRRWFTIHKGGNA